MSLKKTLLAGPFFWGTILYAQKPTEVPKPSEEPINNHKRNSPAHVPRLRIQLHFFHLICHVVASKQRHQCVVAMLNQVNSFMYMYDQC